MLNGSKTLLRTPTLSDVSFMLDIENDERYWSLSDTDEPFTATDIEEFICNSSSNLRIDKQIRLVIFEIASKEKVGLVDVFDYDAKHKRAGVGIFLLENYRRKGLAADALRVLIQYLFDIIELHQVWCTLLPGNTASKNLFHALGFRQSGTKKDWAFFDNAYHDELFMQLINPKHLS